jgi:hypothetical protein
VQSHMRVPSFQQVCGVDGCPVDPGGDGPVYTSSYQVSMSSGKTIVNYDDAGQNFASSANSTDGSVQFRTNSTLNAGSSSYVTNNNFTNASSGAQATVSYTNPYPNPGQVDTISFSNGTHAVRTMNTAYSGSSVVTDQYGQQWQISVSTSDGLNYDVQYSGPENGEFSFTIPNTAPSSIERTLGAVRIVKTAQCVAIMEHTASVLGNISAAATVLSLLSMNPAFAIVGASTGVVGWFYGTFAHQVCG